MYVKRLTNSDIRSRGIKHKIYRFIAIEKAIDSIV